MTTTRPLPAFAGARVPHHVPCILTLGAVVNVGTTMFALTYASGAFVAVGQGLGGNAYYGAFRSTDGFTWTSTLNAIGVSATNHLACVAGGAGKIVAGGNQIIYTSSDGGFTWVFTTIISYTTSVAWNGTNWLVETGSGTGYSYISTDGISWTAIPNYPKPYYPNSLGSSNYATISDGAGRFVVAGYGVSLSTDGGRTWADDPGVSQLYQFQTGLYGGGQFLIGGLSPGGTLSLKNSLTGTSFTELASPPVVAGATAIYSMCYDGDCFLVGFGVSSGASRIAASPDLVNWSYYTTSASLLSVINGLASNGTVVVAMDPNGNTQLITIGG